MKPFECSNQLINHLDEPSRKLILKHCECLFVSAGSILGLPGSIAQYAYFPSGCVITLMLQQRDDKGIEVGVIGEEGMLGIEVMLGVRQSPYLILVQSDGMVLRIASDRLLKIIARQPSIQLALRLYVAVLMQQLAQSSLCSHFHLVQGRVARLLLMFRDRIHSNTIQITHELLADMLGVRRVGVTRAAGILQKQHTLRYARGRVEILNDQALEAAACTCYAIDKSTYLTILNR